MRTHSERRSRSLFSSLGLAVVVAAVAVSTGHAPIRAEQSTQSAERGAAGQSETLLPDGSVLLVGGESDPKLVAIRRPDGTLNRVASAPLTPRAWHTATLLSDGSVLVLGGVDVRGRTIAAPERFIPGSGTFAHLPTEGLSPRSRHTTTVLSDGRVLIAGGGDPAARNDADLWEPAAQRAHPLQSTMSVTRSGHSATLLPDGRVLIVGGAGDLASVDIFDPSDAEFIQAARTPREPDTLSVTWTSPADRATDVSIEPFIAIRLSRPADVRSISENTIRFTGPEGDIPVVLVPAERGRLIFLQRSGILQPGSKYRISIAGVATAAGIAVRPVEFSFTTGADGDEERRRVPDDELWVAGANDEWRSGRGSSPWQSLPPLGAAPGVTALAGQVLRLNGAPLQGVTLKIEGRSARSDQSGRFLLIVENLESGEHTLAIDGSTANRGNKTYGFYEARIRLRAGITNTLPFTIWSPVLDTAHAVSVPSPTAAETVVTSPGVPGLELHLPAGTVIRDEDHNIVKMLTITPIPLDRTPFPLPTDARFTMFFTIQPGGAYVSTPGPIRGAWLVYPNRTSFKSGTEVRFFNYDPDDKGWYVYGLGTVKGAQVIPNPHTRLYAFTGASFDSGDLPPPVETPSARGEPVNVSTGAFVMQATDLYLSDVVPIVARRNYDARDNQQRAFGRGMTNSYSLFQYTTNSYNTGDLVLPDGEQIHYVRISASGLPWYQTVFECQTGPTPFYKSRLLFNGNAWEYRLKDGTVYVMGHQAPIQSIRDRYGNETRLTWSQTNVWGAGYGNLIRITSSNGRWIEFTYDSASPVNHVVQAKDHIGRVVGYSYDVNGNLSTVTDPEGSTTTYTWDTSNRLTSITNARGITSLTNQYDTSNRVVHQTLADPSATYGFAYTTDANGNITRTDVTDPRGHVERLMFNASHYLTSDTEAYGTSLVRTTTVQRQAGTDLITAVVDPLNRRTELTYDGDGHILTQTRLAGTAGAVTTTFTYEPIFFQLASVTDPMNHTWTTNYDSAGRLIGNTDPLNHQTNTTLAASGSVTQITDPLQHSWQFGYTNGDLTSTTDPLGNVRSQFVDQAGRVISSTDPLGHVLRTAYDKVDRVTSVTDQMGGVTSFTYDANSNLTSVSDALTHTTTYTYDNSDRLETRTDPRSHTASYAYDLADNISQVTDRGGQITAYTYDALDRLTQVVFNDQSTISYTYDLGDRITQISDSINGTIARGYDDLDRLIQESSARGTVDYSYDADGRRVSMTIDGQNAITYSYDDADRLTSITKGSATASFAYDAASRRTSTTYPSGIVAAYSYDDANRLAGITFTNGQTTIGDLTYAYDATGNRTAVGGSWARTGLPTALANGSYDVANRIVSWGGISSSYDVNGNLTNDGTNQYTWNARGQLASVSGGTSTTFAYDALGRRRSKTVGTTTTDFLHDGPNVAQESSGGTPVASFLAGPRIDEILTRTDAGGTASLLADGLGSTVALAAANGTIQTAYTYEPFGRATVAGSAGSNSVTFTGREADLADLMFYRARFYNPQFGRFLSEDPIEFSSGTVNLYEYAFDNPTGYTDPLGTQNILPLQPPTPRVIPPTVAGLVLFDAALIVYDIGLINQLGEASGWWGPAASGPGAGNKNKDKCPKGKWTCEASAHAVPIVGQAPPGAQAFIVRNTGSGGTQSEAARAALDAVQAMSPRGFYIRHPHIIGCWRR